MATTCAAVAVVTALLLGACGNDGNGSAAGLVPAPAGEVISEVEAVRAFMTDRYLYASRLPSADLSAVTTAEQALSALRVEPPDRFSYVERRSTHQAFFDDGYALGLGIGYLVDAGTIRLRFVQPHSPAAAAGLRRGDELVAIDDVAAGALIDSGAVVAAFGASEAGATVRFEVRRGPVRFEATVTKDWYPVEPILHTRLIEHRGEKIGYLMLYTFTEPARAAWAEAIDALATAGARSLVVDLRDNGGGRLFVAAEVSGALAPIGAGGAVFTVLQHNDGHRLRDRFIAVPPNPLAGTFERVVWIASRRTCSASEVLIAGLMPFRDAAVIGSTTCGKPVGFNPFPIGEKVLSAVTFIARNGEGFGEWFDGLPPTCRVDDEPLLPYGDPDDPSLREALAVLSTGQCSAMPTLKSTRSLRSPDAPQPREQGLASETGLR